MIFKPDLLAQMWAKFNSGHQILIMCIRAKFASLKKLSDCGATVPANVIIYMISTTKKDQL